MNAENTDNTQNSRSDEVIAEYLQAVEAGGQPDKQALIDANPDCADELREFFADQAQFARAARPFKADPPAEDLGSADPDAPTVADAVLHEPPDPLPGTLVRYFGDYELLQEIARGGMGVVYEAKQISLNRTVALKMILSGQLASEAEVRRFHQEAEAAANLDHANIVPIYEVGVYKGRHYFTMKLIEGGPLSEHLGRLKGDHRASAGLMTKVARGVHFAHQRGILHRDLKPANILLDPEDQPHVTDFGLAKLVDGQQGLTITKPGGVLGTPAYMPPEQASGEKDLTTAADVYSLGAILYALLTGEPPFRAATPLDTMRQVMDKTPRPLRSVNAAVPRDLETICLKCLEKDPQRRYDSAGALADELERWLNHEPITARPVSVGGKMVRWCRRNPALAAVLAVAASVVITLSSVYYVNLTAEHVRTVAALGREQNARRQTEVQSERAKDALASSQYEQARAILLSSSPGRRWRAMELLREANTLRTRDTRTNRAGDGTGAIPMPSAADLRTAAIATLMQTDAREVAQGDVMMGFAPKVSADGRVAVTPYMTGIDLSRAAPLSAGTFQPGKAQAPKIGIRVLNTATCNEIARIPDLGKFASFGLLSPTVSSDGKMLGILGPSGARIMSLPSGKHIKTLELPPDKPTTRAAKQSMLTVGSGAFGPDDKRFAAVRHTVLGASGKTEVIVWNIETAKSRSVGSWDSSKQVVNVAFSTTGKLIAVTDRSTTLRLIDLTGAPSVREIRLPMETFGAAAFSGDDAFLAVSCMGGKLHQPAVLLWDILQNKEKLRLSGGSGGDMPVPMNAPGLSPDSKRLAVGGRDGNVAVFDAETGAELWRIKGAQRGGATLVKWHPDGRHLIVAGADGRISRWEISPKAPVIDLPTGGKFRQFAFSPDSRQLAVSSSRVAGKPDVTRLILLSTGQVQHEFPLAGRLLFRPDGKQLAVISSSSSKKLQAVVYDLAGGDEVFRTERPRAKTDGLNFNSAAFGPQGQLLMVRRETDSTVVLDMPADKPYATVPWGKQVRGGRIKLTPDARMLVRIVRGPIGPRYEVWDLVNRRTHMQIDLVEGSMAIELPRFTPDYQWAALVYFVTDFAATRTRDSSGPGGADKQAGVLLQNAKTPGKQVHIRNRQMPVSIDIHPDGKLLAVACLAGAIEVYTLPNMKRVFTLQTTDKGDPFIRFTPDGKSLAVGRYRQSRLQLVGLDELKRELAKIHLGW